MGALTVGIDVGLLALLADGLELPLVVATPAAFLVSVVFNFSVNRLLATGDTPGRLGRQAFRYVVLLLANLLFTTALVVVGARLGVPYLAAKGVAVVVSTGWNFLLYRRWVFAPG